MKRVIPALVILCVVISSGISARDMMERPSAVVPGKSPGRFALLPAGYADVTYVSHSVRSGRHDTFWISNSAHFGVADLLNQRLGLYYSTYLFSGPVDDPSRQGSRLAPWLMNAVQYEYGLSWRYAPVVPAPGSGLPGALEFVADYGRRSFHPFRKGFADPASDILRGGVALSGFPAGNGFLDALLRLRWSRLFDFWGTDIADPRSTWSVQPAVEYQSNGLSIADTGRVGLFVVGSADLLLVESGLPDGEFAGEAGIFLEASSLGGTAGGNVAGGPDSRRKLEIYLNGYYSGDTEELPEEAYAVALLGFGARLSVMW